MKRIIILLSVLLLSVSTFAQETESERPLFGYKLQDYMSKPKFGAYIVGFYKYSDLKGAHSGQGLGVRYIRAYVDGSILNDFKYRIQFEINGSPHVKDFYLEWARFKEFSVKIGEFKRAFTFENPYNPWDVGVGDYSQAVKKLAGMGDRCGESSMGGRDLGIQFQGDFLPVGNDQHRLFHYQIGLYNGNGINRTDNNSRKDIMGTIQIQPIKDLYLGAFVWNGNWSDGTVTVDRKRYAFGAKYEHNNWSARTEYVHSKGYKASSIDHETGELIPDCNDRGKADAFYATVGVPVVDWFKVFVKYDNYRDNANSASRSTIYSIAPQIRLHKNLMFQFEYRYNDNKMTGKKYNEFWFEYYVRF